MKNIEYYYDEISKARYYDTILRFANENGMIPRDEMSDTQNLMKWLNEEHQILDDVEKKYLRNILEPLKTENTFLKKEQDANCCAEFIYVGNVKGYKKGKTDFMYLPFFKRGTMYKGMEQGRKYTLEELGL